VVCQFRGRFGAGHRPSSSSGGVPIGSAFRPWCNGFMASVCNCRRVGASFPAFCSRCGGMRTFVERRPRLVWNLVLSCATLGLWAPIWFLLVLFAEMRPWRCLSCNWHKPEFSGRRFAGGTGQRAGLVAGAKPSRRRRNRPRRAAPHVRWKNLRVYGAKRV